MIATARVYCSHTREVSSHEYFNTASPKTCVRSGVGFRISPTLYNLSSSARAIWLLIHAYFSQNVQSRDKSMLDTYRFRMLAPSALVFLYVILLFLHLSSGARKMKKKQNDIQKLFQAA